MFLTGLLWKSCRVHVAASILSRSRRSLVAVSSWGLSFYFFNFFFKGEQFVALVCEICGVAHPEPYELSCKVHLVLQKSNINRARLHVPSQTHESIIMVRQTSSSLHFLSSLGRTSVIS